MTTTELFLITIDSDKAGSDRCRLAASRAIKAAPHCDQVRDSIWTLDEATRFLLADNLKDYVERLIDDVEANDERGRRTGGNSTASCVAKTLVRCAFEDIDWHEVADHYLTKLAENGKAVTA